MPSLGATLFNLINDSVEPNEDGHTDSFFVGKLINRIRKENNKDHLDHKQIDKLIDEIREEKITTEDAMYDKLLAKQPIIKDKEEKMVVVDG